MAFTEALKGSLRKASDFACCVCRSRHGLEIHHIVPQEENGPNTEDNAAPLCPACHDLLGANRSKRKYIRECRDHWFETCRSGDETLTSLRKIEKLVEQQVVQSASRRTRSDLSLGQVIEYYFRRSDARGDLDTETTESLSREIFFHDALWNETEVEIRDDFFQKFGFETARRLMLVAIDDAGITAKGFTEPEVLSAFWIMFVSMTTLLNHADLAGVRRIRFQEDADGKLRMKMSD